MAAQLVKSICAVALITALLIAPPAEAALGCGAVVQSLTPCIAYVTNRGPIGTCCTGVRGLYGAAKTTADRQSVCTCLKTLAGSNPGINYQKAAGLPGQCKVNIPYKISPRTDCSKVK